MEVRMIVANPAGNITAFVLNEEIAVSQYQAIANQIMALPKYGIEQVGYVKPPINGGEARLEMMGLEFCGNASRSFGKWILDKQKKNHPQDQKLKEKTEIDIEITGSKALMHIVTGKDSAKARMPLPQKINKLSCEGIEYPAVVFEGITHIIVENSADTSLEFAEKLIGEANRLWKPEAVGVMFYEEASNSLRPIVYVKETDSTVCESSCGSGSVATAIYKSLQQGDGEREYVLTQPGGTVKASARVRGGTVTEAFIDGSVSYSAEVVVEIS